MRDSPFSAAARENLGKWRSTWEVPPHRFSGMGGVPLHTEKPILSVPKNVGLLESARDLDGVVRFPHGLARQAVPDLMTEYQRATENARVAKVLEEQFPAVDLRVQRLAHHYANAQALGYADKAVLYLARAAGAAEVGLAHHEAARLLERAAGIANDAGQRDELRLQAARSYLRA